MKRRLMVLGFLGLAGLGALPSQAMAYTDRDYCREYTRTVTIGGRPEHAYGTACLQPDGQWLIVSEAERPVAYHREHTPPPSKVIYIQEEKRPYGYRGRSHHKRYDDHHHRSHKTRYDSDHHGW